MFDFGDVVEPHIARRREVVFMILSGLFLGSLTMLNILGITKFIDLSFVIFGYTVPFSIAVGVLAYPVTFLCTDFISELYGRHRANLVVWIGLMLNIWTLFILYVGGLLPPYIDNNLSGIPYMVQEGMIFHQVRTMAFGAVSSSMIAYMTAQFVDVHIFHLLKKLTKGKHLWLRNNVSTMVSQLVDSTAVILITHFYARELPPLPGNHNIVEFLMIYILSSYLFKFVAALLDTIPFYIGTKFLTKYLHIPEETYLD